MLCQYAIKMLAWYLKFKIYKTILPVVLYICEIWSLTLREQCRLNVFENRKRIFGLKRRDIEEKAPHSLYRSLNIVSVIESRKLRWAGHLVRMEGGRVSFKILTD